MYKNADESYKEIIVDIDGHGEMRNTRSGRVKSTFAPREFRYSMRDGTAPFLTGKQLFAQPMVGELLWFCGGDHSIHQLQERTWGKADGQNTIWTPDQIRWFNGLSPENQKLLKYPDDLGRTYGRQWRNSAGKFGTQVDQLDKLIKNLRYDPQSRYHIVNAWNAAEINANMMALAPCHVMFQCYVSNDGELSLKWYQRSVDVFLGLPFNIASYGTLLLILCELTGYEPGDLIGTFGDAHIYEAHFDAVAQYMANPTFPAPFVDMPAIGSLEHLERMTALDFKDAFCDYRHAGKVAAPLLVG